MTRGDVNQVGLDLSIVDRDVERLDEGGFVWFGVGASKSLLGALVVAEAPAEAEPVLPSESRMVTV